MHKNARAFKAHAFIAHGVGYVKKKARAFISRAMHIKARDMKKTARGGWIAIFLEKARAVVVHRCSWWVDWSLGCAIIFLYNASHHGGKLQLT